MKNKTKEDVINSLNENMKIVKKYVKNGFDTKRFKRDNEMFNRGYISAYIDEGILTFNDLNNMLIKLM